MYRVLISALLAACASATHAERVENFVLLDHRGDAHELYYHDASPAVVVMVQGNACPAVRSALPEFAALRERFEPSGVKFFMLNSNLQDDRTALQAEADAYGIDVPILDDETQLIGESLDLSHAGEILVINPKSWTIAYRGPISEAASDEKTSFAANALEAVLAGEQVATANRETVGCSIDLAQADSNHASISYVETIAPLLKENCVVCHTEGGLGPWAMSSYTMVQGFAPMIREVLRTKRMPPWHADPHIGVFKNDRSLSVEDMQTLVHWVEAGAPRGDGPDPLSAAQTASVEWPLGEPDLVLDIPEYAVPASGVVDYQFPNVANPLDRGVWVKAATVVPGDREVVHHILAGSMDADSPGGRRTSGVFDNYLIGYAPGNESHTFPEGTGVYIAPGGEFSFQMHYTPVGRETVDRSKIGLYFHEEQPENFYRQDVVVNPTIRIPPNEARHKEVAYYQFDQPALLHDLVPHSHYRGVASKFELWKPDGTKEVILSVPNYDFNWQRTYEFIEPKYMEAGTKLVHTTWYDNSSANPANPDSERTVTWGLQSWEEMLYGAFSYTYVDETTESPIHDKSLSRTKQLFGFLDHDLDGKVTLAEMPDGMKQRFEKGFGALDANGDGGLDVKEMHFFTQIRLLGGAPRGNSDAR
jgi:peroxiredoxin